MCGKQCHMTLHAALLAESHVSTCVIEQCCGLDIVITECCGVVRFGAE